jgi:glycosyltransferase involved in cell wall biosynthesis
MNDIMNDSLINFPRSNKHDKNEWPWNIPIFNQTNFDNDDLPSITIITPSFNQGDYIEETIRSIILQNYPKLQYIIVDGGSTDDTLNIIEKYKDWIDVVISESDNGQSHAINKGWKLAKGEITTWINSDDLLAPNCLYEVAKLANSSSSRSLIIGDVINFHKKHQVRIRQRNIVLQKFLFFWSSECIWHQPGIFFPMESITRVGFLDTQYHYSMDFDLLCKILVFSEVVYSDKVFTYFRIHNTSKGVSYPSKTINEKLSIFLRNRNENVNINTLRDYINFFIWLLKFLLKSRQRFNLNFKDIYKLIFNI